MSQRECLHRCDDVRSIVWSQWCSIILQNISIWHCWDETIKKQPRLLLGVGGSERCCQGCVLVVFLWPTNELCLSLHCLMQYELSWRHGSMSGVLQKAELCAVATKQRACLCSGAGTAERACLDSVTEYCIAIRNVLCHPQYGVVLSVSSAIVSHRSLTSEMCAHATQC